MTIINKNMSALITLLQIPIIFALGFSIQLSIYCILEFIFEDRKKSVLMRLFNFLDTQILRFAEYEMYAVSEFQKTTGDILIVIWNRTINDDFYVRLHNKLTNLTDTNNKIHIILNNDGIDFTKYSLYILNDLLNKFKDRIHIHIPTVINTSYYKTIAALLFKNIHMNSFSSLSTICIADDDECIKEIITDAITTNFGNTAASREIIGNSLSTKRIYYKDDLERMDIKINNIPTLINDICNSITKPCTIIV